MKLIYIYIYIYMHRHICTSHSRVVIRQTHSTHIFIYMYILGKEIMIILNTMQYNIYYNWKSAYYILSLVYVC